MRRRWEYEHEFAIDCGVCGFQICVEVGFTVGSEGEIAHAAVLAVNDVCECRPDAANALVRAELWLETAAADTAMRDHADDELEAARHYSPI